MAHRPIVFYGGKFALLSFKKQDGKVRYVLYEERGRKLKHGKRRFPVATVDLDGAIDPAACEREDALRAGEA